MKNIWAFLFTVLLASSGFAQDTTALATEYIDSTIVVADTAVPMIDSVELRYGMDLCDTLPELADSIFKVLKTKKFDRLIPYIPTSAMLSEQFDSMDIKQLQRLSEIKHQYLVNNLRKQHIKMVKYSKVMHYSLRHMELIKTRIREKDFQEGTRYGEVTYLCKSGRRKFYITFIAIEIVGKWFIGDELRVVDI